MEQLPAGGTQDSRTGFKHEKQKTGDGGREYIKKIPKKRANNLTGTKEWKKRGGAPKRHSGVKKEI